MMWEEVSLGEYIDILSGYSFKSKDFIDSGIPVIKIKNVTPPTVSLIDLSFVSKAVANTQKKFQLQYNDVLVALTGSHINQMTSVVGRVARVKYNERTVLNQRVGKIYSINTEACNIDYIYYYLSQDKIKIELANQAGGAANQANISPNDIKSLKIKLPPIETQKRIADILSAYDNLIENNQKQIKLLEEMAQRLYKEWFVDLRFPNYENTEIVDGVPKEWKKCCLSDILDIKYGKDHKGIPDGNISIYGSGGLMRKGNQFLCNGESVLIPRKGSLNNIMYVNEAFWTVDTMFYTQMKIEFAALYVYFFMQRFDMYSMNIGATVPSMTTNILNSLDIIVPNTALLQRFNNIVQNNYKKIAILNNKVNLLQQARDRLLPKLMNRELEV